MVALKIGDVAKAAGVGVDTVRYYERRGLLPAAARRESGYREFTDATVERIQFAKGLQSLGFTLDEVVSLLKSVDAGTADCKSEKHRFELVLARVDQKIAEFKDVRRRLVKTLTRCESGECVLLDKQRNRRAL
ncbi:MAG TPA: MerR family transcriptional regulator [Thermoanaerobaculia bacterium]|nr:MerR family transcriptional regulator [Thermoanaerobaculia bacterium]